jgi:putative FmdB family regulatory protein
VPLYEYQCAKCGRFELIRKFSDPPLTACPTCGAEVQKLLSAPAIQFKGAGWYITDYARKGSGEGGDKKAGKESGGSDGGSKDGGSKDGASKDGGSKDGGGKDAAAKSDSTAATSTKDTSSKPA